MHDIEISLQMYLNRMPKFIWTEINIFFIAGSEIERQQHPRMKKYTLSTLFGVLPNVFFQFTTPFRINNNTTGIDV